MKRLVIGALFALVIAAPVNAAKPTAFITVRDEVAESPGWARYPIDSVYGSALHATYGDSKTFSNWARFTCTDEAGAPVWDSGRRFLQGEGGYGVSVDITYTQSDFPYRAGTYSLCRVDLLGKGDRVIATDAFVIYAPV